MFHTQYARHDPRSVSGNGTTSTAHSLLCEGVPGGAGHLSTKVAICPPLLDVGNKYRQTPPQQLFDSCPPPIAEALNGTIPDNVQRTTGLRQEDYAQITFVPFPVTNKAVTTQRQQTPPPLLQTSSSQACLIVLADGHGSIESIPSICFGGFDVAKYAVEQMAILLAEKVKLWTTPFHQYYSQFDDAAACTQRAIPNFIIQDIHHVFTTVARRVHEHIEAGAEPVVVFDKHQSSAADTMNKMSVAETYDTNASRGGIIPFASPLRVRGDCFSQYRNMDGSCPVSTFLQSTRPLQSRQELLHRIQRRDTNPLDGWVFQSTHLLTSYGVLPPSSIIVDKVAILMPAQTPTCPFPDPSHPHQHQQQQMSPQGNSVIMYLRQDGSLVQAEYGCTMTIVILLPTGHSLHPWLAICANLGDSDAFIVSSPTIAGPTNSPLNPPPLNATIFRLSTQHVAENAAEVERMRQAGQGVTQVNGGKYFYTPRQTQTPAHRLFQPSGLMVSRSLGHSLASKIGQIPFPSICLKHMQRGDFLFVASDGLWDNRWKWEHHLQHIPDLVNEHVKNHRSSSNLSTTPPSPTDMVVHVAKTTLQRLKDAIPAVHPSYRDNTSLVTAQII